MTSGTDEACVFCGIRDGTLPASLVYEDTHCLAFLDIQPVNAGHVLVVPRTHVASLAELAPQTGAHLFTTAQAIAGALYRADLPCEGVNLFLADGAAAGQEVFHLHLHIYPRFSGDGFGFRHDGRHFTKPDRDTLDRLAAGIRNHL